jgi:tetratricopeptide (TPR) repeat protein
MHRRIADAWSSSPDATAHAAEIAHHYLRSRELAGREAGVPFALAAAERAAAARSSGEAARLFQAALDLATADDPRRPRILARLALSLGDLLDDRAIESAQEAAAGISSTESAVAAREFLADAIVAFERAGFTRDVTGRLADLGLELDPDARDACWSVFALNREQRRSESADLPGIPVDIPVLIEIDEVRASQPAPVRRRWDLGLLRVTSPEAARAEGDPAYLLFYTGEYARAAALLEEEAEQAERAGWLRRAAIGRANVARALISLGEIAAARDALQQATLLLGRLPERTDAVLEVAAAREDFRLVRGRPPRPESLQQWELYLAASNEAWAFAGVRSVLAASYAELGETDRALIHIERIVPVIDRAPLWAPNYRGVLWNTITALWFLGVARHPVTIETSVRTKMLEPRLHHPLADARLAMARLAAVDGRTDDARKWFEQARRSTESHGARPLRAIVDHDEALALVRAGGASLAHETVGHLLDSAHAQMRDLRMDGWLERVRTLRTSA